MCAYEYAKLSNITIRHKLKEKKAILLMFYTTQSRNVYFSQSFVHNDTITVTYVFV